jgi:hypothetical protein
MALKALQTRFQSFEPSIAQPQTVELVHFRLPGNEPFVSAMRQSARW